MAQRRPASGGPGGSRRPGGRGSARTATGTGSIPVVRGRGKSGRRPRLTGRAAILVLVMAVLMVSYASSMKAYLMQRSHIEALKAQIAEREQSIEALEREKRRWEDPAYVQQQAHARFGYIFPGQKSYVMLDGSGQPIDSHGGLNDPEDVVKVAPTAWWTTAWGSVELAGNPPPMEPPPADEIRDPAKKIASGSQ